MPMPSRSSISSWRTKAGIRPPPYPNRRSRRSLNRLCKRGRMVDWLTTCFGVQPSTVLPSYASHNRYARAYDFGNVGGVGTRVGTIAAPAFVDTAGRCLWRTAGGGSPLEHWPTRCPLAHAARVDLRPTISRIGEVSKVH